MPLRKIILVILCLVKTFMFSLAFFTTVDMLFFHVKKISWETADDVRNIIELDDRDKMSKIRRVLDWLNKKFITNAPDCKNISVESMIHYFYRNVRKQFLRLKSVRFCFKDWVMAQSSGYLLPCCRLISREKSQWYEAW
ncbi:hypothetical protein PR048_010866 [Dryococelus australis]|uniref:PiggyBac transposable element-derived protein domain-containing protein n=1 Tax=Dryococelus australis TaxID=614101 RepID=A0ABQ9I3Y5_9NEOP|nr:hypothetical protein PR048_010866 [Dryococelus australis]